MDPSGVYEEHQEWSGVFVEIASVSWGELEEGWELVLVDPLVDIRGGSRLVKNLVGSVLEWDEVVLETLDRLELGEEDELGLVG